MLDFAIFAVSVIVFLIVTIIYLYPGSKKITTVPGPDPCDTLEGNFPDIKASGSLHEFLLDSHKQYGPIVSFWWGPQLAISIASPQLFKEHSKVFDRPPGLFKLVEPLITPRAIQFINGADGRLRHSTYARCYSDQAMDNYYDTFHTLSAELLKKLQTLPTDDHIPIMQYFFSFTIKSILQTSCGEHFDDRKILRLRQSYDVCWFDLEETLRGETNLSDTLSEERFEKHKKCIFDILRESVEHRKNNLSKDDKQNRLIDALLDLHEGDMDTLLADMLAVIIGGFHTAGLLLTWGTYFLASHPEVQERLQEELDDHLEGGKVTPDNIEDLVYMRQVLDESLRCSVLAPWAARFQDIDVELGGHKIPARTPVIHALGVSLQDEELWPEPEKFDPDRFSPENRKNLPSFGFEPFGFAGKRKCMGYRFAYVEVTVLLAVLLQKYTLNLVPGQVVQPEYGLVTKPKEEIWMTVTNRK